jgi:UPF0271 protein
VAAPVIDLNADLGEGFDDDALLAVVTSANVACGFHAGDGPTMRRVCEEAAVRSVAVGAQVSYDDRDGFGRRPMDVPPALLAEQVSRQILDLGEQAAAAGTAVTYVKPHGALYNRVVGDPKQADAVVAGLRAAGVGALPVLCLPGSALHDAARAAGLPIVAEAFVDRGYSAEGHLVPRGQPGALIAEPDDVVARALDLAWGRHVTTASGSSVLINAHSLCLHGDTPGAAALGNSVRAVLERSGVVLRAFAPAP